MCTVYALAVTAILITAPLFVTFSGQCSSCGGKKERKVKAKGKANEGLLGKALAVAAWASVFGIIWGNILGYVEYTGPTICALVFFMAVAILTSMAIWSPRDREAK